METRSNNRPERIFSLAWAVPRTAAWHRLPGLRELRGRLIGRALHTSPTAWAEQFRTLV